MQRIEARRFILIYRIVLIAFVAGMALSPSLWEQNRFFPLAPVWSTLPGKLNGLLLVLTGILFCVNFIWMKRSYMSALIITICILLLEDQNRLQPWVYMYLLLLLPYTILRNDYEKLLLGCCRMTVAGIYFWSGVHKLNNIFVDQGFTSMLHRFLHINDANLIASLRPFGYAIGGIEIAIAVLLIFPRGRRFGVWLALASHIFILVYLSPLGISYNSVIYPWNVAMVLLVFALFYRTQEKIGLMGKTGIEWRLVPIAVVVWFFPLLNFAGYWDNYLSFSLYSYKTGSYFVAVADNAIPKIDQRYKKYFVQQGGINGGQLIDVNEWSIKELNVPMYPEHRVFRTIAQAFCNTGVGDNSVYFIEVERHNGVETRADLACGDLQ